jgi:hypothetical protein
MSSKHKVKHHPYCLNCHYPLAEFDKMCSQCGQKPTDGKTTMHDLLHEFIHTLFHLDGKFFWTLKHIFIPGKLTIEFFKGHHKRYAHPVQLFLVLGVLVFGLLISVLTNKEKELKKYLSEEEIFKKSIFMKLDSLKYTLPEYKNRDVANAIDSLLWKGSGRINQNIADLAILKQWQSGRLKMDSLQKKLTELSKNVKDVTPEQEVEKNDKAKAIVEDLKEEIKDFKKELRKDSTEAMAILKGIQKMDIGIATFEQSTIDLDSNDLDEIIADYQTKPKKSQPFILDSTSIGMIGGMGKVKSYKIAKVDMYHYSEEELMEKYQVEGFWNKINFKQSLKFTKSGQEDFKNYFFSKFIWITILAILPMAGFYMLLYRRQKRFYVEHFVFLMHYCIMIFGLAIIYLLLELWDFSKIAGIYGMLVYSYLVFIAMPIAMKNFYQQSWRKTIFKFFIAGFVFIIVAFIVILLAGIVMFAFF